MSGTNTQIIVLAAGLGKRMNSDLPKVLVPLKGRPLVAHLLETIDKANISLRPILVVGQKRELVMAEFGARYQYAIQPEQLGTGHAVQCAQALCADAEKVIVLYGDHPYVSAETIQKLATGPSVITLATTTVPDFKDWREGFFNFGRIVRDEENKIIKIVEKKDATEAESEITEINPAYFCFDAKWLWANLPTLKNENAQGEYYLTDLIGLAQQQNHPIDSIQIEPHEALGVNTPEQLAVLESDLIF